MVAPLIALAVGAGMGIMKQQNEERKFQRAAKLAAAKTELSPFNPDIAPGMLPEEPNASDNLLAGVMTGAGIAGKNPSLFGGGDEAAKSADAVAAAEPQSASLTDPDVLKQDRSAFAPGTDGARRREPLAFDVFSGDPREEDLFGRSSFSPTSISEDEVQMFLASRGAAGMGTFAALQDPNVIRSGRSSFER